jgi:type VI secretion system protein ImpE
MSPIELFQEGRLREAIEAQQSFLNAHPTEIAARVLLCELLLHDGDLQAVREHLDHLPLNFRGMEKYIATYRHLLDAEEMRREILRPRASDKNPLFLIDPSPQLTERIEALQAHRSGEHGRCVEKLDNADALLPPITGHVDGRAFAGVRDGDDLLAHVLEVLIDGQYAWFPFEQIERLRLGPIDNLRDRIYVPASIRSITGEEWQVHLPALYPDTHLNEDEEVKAGQASDWYAEDDGPIRGVGLRVLSFGEEEELTLLDFTMWEE